MKHNLLLIITIALLSVGCKSPSKIGAAYQYKTECIGVELDGSETLRSWGQGRNRVDAIEQAKKNAVRDVLFKGIMDGSKECNMKPLVPEVNAQDKYENYFNTFFADQGDYKNFVNSKDGSDLHPEVLKNREKLGSQEEYRIIVRVLRSDLKQKLIQDGILKQ
ncbi:MAG: hypothetical protein ACKOX3_08510 [Bacteroidota bacterium]